MSSLSLLCYFFRLGLTGFGGPLAVIAQIQRDLVDQRKVIDEDEFLRSLSLIKSLPGAVSVQVIAFWAYRLYGIWIAILSSILFVLPAFLMMLVLAIFYDQFRASTQLVRLMDGMQAGAFIIILMALHTLSKGSYSQLKFWVLFLLSLLFMGHFKILEPLMIISAGLLSVYWPKFKSRVSLHSFVLTEIFWSCLKAGGLTFGTGFAMIPILQADFVDLHHWVSQQQFMDAIAFGQLTPGPVTISVTFIGPRSFQCDDLVPAHVQVVFSANLGETFCHRRDGGDCSRNFAGSCFNCRNSHRCANGFSSFTFNYEFSFQNSKLGDCGCQWD
jgi:chromate transporter